MTQPCIIGALLSPVYIAGFFDGEGCIYLGRKWTKRPACPEACWAFRVSIVNTHKPILDQIQRQYAGRVRQVKGQKSPRWRDSWVWAVHAKSAAKFLTEITPFLQEKRKRAEAALFFCDTYTWPKNWRELTSEAKHLRRIALAAFQANPNIRGRSA